LKWAKAPEEHKLTIDSLMKGVDCEKRPMFGYPAYFIKKNMFAGLFQDKLFLRLSPDQVTVLKETFPSFPIWSRYQDDKGSIRTPRRCPKSSRLQRSTVAVFLQRQRKRKRRPESLRSCGPACSAHFICLSR
jgi:hypothetical protein